MEAIKFVDVVKEDWLLINPELKKYLNQEVEIQISPIEGKSMEVEGFGIICNSTAEETKRFINKNMIPMIVYTPIYDEEERKRVMEGLIGCFDDETAKHFFDAVAECRQIDYEEWK